VAADVNGFVVNGGSGANTFTVTGTPTTQANGFYGPTLTLNAGSGSDVINVLGMGNGTGLNVFGQSGDDYLNVDYTAGGIALKHNITFDGGTPGLVGDSLGIKGLANSTFQMTQGHVNKGANGHVEFSNIKTLACNGGWFDANGDMNLPVLAAQNASTFVNFNTSQTIGKLYVDAAQTALAPDGSLSLNVNSLSIVNSGKLDLADNSMLITYGNTPDPLATIRGYLSSGYDNGAWDGAGISSSSAQLDASHRTGIGYSDSADGTGANLTPNSIKLTYTLYGDANLDRQVDTIDFNFLAANFSAAGKIWSQGDFNYEGVVDTIDFNLLASNFSQVLPGGVPKEVSGLAKTSSRSGLFSGQRITQSLAEM